MLVSASYNEANRYKNRKKADCRMISGAFWINIKHVRVVVSEIHMEYPFKSPEDVTSLINRFLKLCSQLTDDCIPIITFKNLRTIVFSAGSGVGIHLKLLQDKYNVDRESGEIHLARLYL
ncbi:hypothetical protein K7432_009383 [Basidiobolus ranarum]|uniref:Uncharacterized protein n=1 Tax=Basidiobolus ranarum TaxID=34480 RepID=A0ABR2VX43_9FUNG